MAYSAGVVQPPIIMFANGIECEVIRSMRTTKNGKTYVRLVMSPFDWTYPMIGIRDANKELDYKEFRYGTLTREYLESRIVILSNNPEKPVWFGLTTFDGVVPSTDSNELAKVLNLVQKIEDRDERIKLLEAENKRLQKENFKYAIHSREFIEMNRNLDGNKQLMPMDEMQIGEVQINKSVKQGG